MGVGRKSGSRQEIGVRAFFAMKPQKKIRPRFSYRALREKTEGCRLHQSRNLTARFMA